MSVTMHQSFLLSHIEAFVQVDSEGNAILSQSEKAGNDRLSSAKQHEFDTFRPRYEAQEAGDHGPSGGDYGSLGDDYGAPRNESDGHGFLHEGPFIRCDNDSTKADISNYRKTRDQVPGFPHHGFRGDYPYNDTCLRQPP
ncbi:hypothetical protein KP509_28G037000 [Ceratopteris richardii]|nr:hypothetical protein KP509_28G037000 [Ceratopteris richardii]